MGIEGHCCCDLSLKTKYCSLGMVRDLDAFDFNWVMIPIMSPVLATVWNGFSRPLLGKRAMFDGEAQWSGNETWNVNVINLAPCYADGRPWQNTSNAESTRAKKRCVCDLIDDDHKIELRSRLIFPAKERSEKILLETKRKFNTYSVQRLSVQRQPSWCSAVV